MMEMFHEGALEDEKKKEFVLFGRTRSCLIISLRVALLIYKESAGESCISAVPADSVRAFFTTRARTSQGYGGRY